MSRVLVVHLAQDVQLLQLQAQEGFVPMSAARRAEVELREAEAELELARLELARIDDRLGR